MCVFVYLYSAVSLVSFACAFFTCQESLGSSAPVMQCDGLRKLAYSLATFENSFPFGAHIHNTYLHVIAVLQVKHKRAELEVEVGRKIVRRN